MQSIYDIKNRLKTVNSTVELTRAMYLISASRIRKAMRLYGQHGNFISGTQRRAIKHILVNMPSISHKFLQKEHDEHKNTAYIVIASNKGMAGGYNHDICTAALEHMQKCKGGITLFTVGNIAASFFKREGYKIEYEYTSIINNPTISAARRMMEGITERMELNSIDQVYVAYTHMDSSISQTPRVERLLPLLLSDFEDIQFRDEFVQAHVMYEPDPVTVINALVPQYVMGMLYGMLVQAYASEHSVRMRAMDEATRNAEEMIGELELKYNGARQSAITQEITEIVSGAGAVDGVSR